MRCPECNSDNPAENRFCGMCGRRLVPAQYQTAPNPGEDVLRGSIPAGREVGLDFDRPPENRDDSAISGPSFLGLGEGSPGQPESYSYLLEDPPRRSYGWFIVAVLLVVGAGAYVAYRHQDLLPPAIQKRLHPSASAPQATPTTPQDNSSQPATNPSAPAAQGASPN